MGKVDVLARPAVQARQQLRASGRRGPCELGRCELGKKERRSVRRGDAGAVDGFVRLGEELVADLSRTDLGGGLRAPSGLGPGAGEVHDLGGAHSGRSRLENR